MQFGVSGLSGSGSRKQVDSTLLIAAGASFLAGLLGYVMARLWIKPIVRYTITKRKLDRELTRYLAQMNKKKDNGVEMNGKETTE